MTLRTSLASHAGRALRAMPVTGVEGLPNWTTPLIRSRRCRYLPGGEGVRVGSPGWMKPPSPNRISSASSMPSADCE
ncbi:Uncharacterised protein [Mycobacteroides abscessus subsp. abscessus]|nr:Uncharacterised protein [Mycobacteroides abscessus subsp. abscessus]